MARPIHFADRLSESDAFMWDIERDPALRSTIVSVFTLDGQPDWERFTKTLDRTSREIPRLRQRVVADALGLAPPRWEIDPNFDIHFHVRHITAPGKGTVRNLLALAEPIGMHSFDRDRPLWEFYRVDGLEGGRSGLIMKIHHAISDGVGMVRMTAGLMETSPEVSKRERKPMPPVPEADTPTSWERVVDAAKHRFEVGRKRNRAVATGLGGSFTSFASNPQKALKSVSDTIGSIGRLLKPVSEPLSSVMTERSLSVRYDMVVVPLAELKQAAKKTGGTVNDAFVGAVAGGLRKYHEELGAPVDELRMTMPINMRSKETTTEAGNQFAPVRFAVPVAIVDPAKRMRRIHQLVDEQRQEPALPLMDAISGALSALPGGASTQIAGSMMKAIDFTTSNVPGPSFPVYLSGARIEHMFGFGPLAGGAANVTCFSYDGNVAIGVNMDPAAVTDPALFVECLKKGVDEVLAIV